MTREELEEFDVEDLRDLAKDKGLKLHHALGKEKVIDALLEGEDQKEEEAGEEPITSEQESETPAEVAVSKAPTFTYVGAGESSPEVINFMGLQLFVLGEETEVTNPRVLSKIQNHPCFVKGAADKRKMMESRQAAAQRAQRKRQADKQADENFKKQHG